jgi:hypothetical protein
MAREEFVKQLWSKTILKSSGDGILHLGILDLFPFSVEKARKQLFC